MAIRGLFAILFMIMSANLSQAHAGVPIPCTATHFIKATHLPDAKDANGQKIVPYYTVGCSSSRWDGYATADGKYHKLNPFVLGALPEAPRFWAAAWNYKAKFWVEWLWIAVGLFVVLGTTLSKYAETYGPAADEAAPRATVPRRS